MHNGFVILKIIITRRTKLISINPGGAILILSAMCCWLKAPNRNRTADEEVIIVAFSLYMLSTSLKLSLLHSVNRKF